MTSPCEQHSLDKVFQRFKVIEFPATFVGLSKTMLLHIDVDLDKCAYLKTTYEGQLMRLEEAREVSPHHRAFESIQINANTLQITFQPTTECISKAKRSRNFVDRFVFDIHLIQINSIRCCNNENHSEIGRYYICGRFEFCQISTYPKIIDFGPIVVHNKVIKCMHIRNNSHHITCKLYYAKVTGFEIVPSEFVLPPNTSKKLSISLRPTSLEVCKNISFKITNYEVPYYNNNCNIEKDNFINNYISYTVQIKCDVTIKTNLKTCLVESLHKLCEQNATYTYTKEEFLKKHKQDQKALNFLKICKENGKRKPLPEKIQRMDNEKYCCNLNLPIIRPTIHFCEQKRKIISIHELFELVLMPYILNFGRVALSTMGFQKIKIQNNSIYKVNIEFFQNDCIKYTKSIVTTTRISINPNSEQIMTIACLAFVEGVYKGFFEYLVEDKFCMQHPYSIQAGNPTVMLQEKSLKFGMITLESFITSVPITIYNYFDNAIEFLWDDLDPDVPFNIIPNKGTVHSHSSKICDVKYICKPTKSKSHEIDLISCGRARKIIPVELNIFTRKHSVKFLQTALMFKDIPLNLEVTQTVKLENSSKEFAIYHIVEPLISGLTIEPMSGIIKPKMITSLLVKIKISCVLELVCDINVKINNKETIILPISGNVVEPKLTIHPKNVYMSRIPCKMITYIPIVFHNSSTATALVRIIDTGDANMFKVYVFNGNEKEEFFEFFVEADQSRTVYIKVYDIFRREYDMYLPFQVNDLLGPPDKNSWTTDLQHYINKYQKIYEGNQKIKIKRVNKDISYCKIMGVITLPWIKFSQDTFIFSKTTNNIMDFSMTNISKYNLPVTIITSKLSSNFILTMQQVEELLIKSDNNMKFELVCGQTVKFQLKFQPKGYGKVESVALMYLDKNLSIPYYNLTFIGKVEMPAMTSTINRIIFPPCNIGVHVTRSLELIVNGVASLDSFQYYVYDEHVSVDLVASRVIESLDQTQTVLLTNITIYCETSCVGNTTIKYTHLPDVCCEIELVYCYTYCILTNHVNLFVKPEDNPYPFYPCKEQDDLFHYMNAASDFLEKWLFFQGFRRELSPVIPDTFNIISTALTTQQSGTKSKGINVSYLNFIRRMVGPLMKYIQKTTVKEPDGDLKYIIEIVETYKEIINLLKSRGADIWILEAKYLLSYDHFIVYCKNIIPKNKFDSELRQKVLNNQEMFCRLNKQCWIDFILQTYKVFVVESCFFECVCISGQPRDIVKIITDWLNKQIEVQYYSLLDKNKNTSIKVINNLTIDLSDGIAIAAAILNHCPFMKSMFSSFQEVDENDKDGSIIHNTCIIIEALHQLKLYFPLNSTDLLNPNFLQMLFLLIHLYIVLPLFRARDVIKFNPPLSRSSTRQISISPSTQETLIFSHVIINNINNAFTVDKISSPDTSKKILFNVKFHGNFVQEANAFLIVQGYNKTRIFDTYIMFYLKGCIGSLIPHKRCKIVCPLYRPNKSDILVSSPFDDVANYKIYIFDVEPAAPIRFEDKSKHKFFVRRINLTDEVTTLRGQPKENTQDVMEQKCSFWVTCLSAQVGNTWLWFKSDIGEFFIKVTTQPRWDIAIEMLQAKLSAWPIRPCNCGDICECYRTTILLIAHKNELMVKCLRYALLENASEEMMNIFDKLIDSETGKVILSMMLEEGGTDMSDISHILKNELNYRITSRTLQPRIDKVIMAQHSEAVFSLPVTILSYNTADKYSLTFTSECGMDIRTYRVLFSEHHDGCETG